MGKVRRERHKYHIAATEKTSTSAISPVKDVEPSLLSLQPILMPDNPFTGINIPFEALNQKLKDSDARSVISTKSVSRAPTVSKKEKRKLRHETFLKKLQAAYHTRKEKGRKVLKLVKDTKSISDKLPPLCLNLGPTDKKDKTRQVKQRSIPKAKKRRKNMMQDIALFKSLLDEFEENNTEEIVSSRVQEKVLSEA